jgi:hypothetical protein
MFSWGYNNRRIIAMRSSVITTIHFMDRVGRPRICASHNRILFSEQYTVTRYGKTSCSPLIINRQRGTSFGQRLLNSPQYH